MKLFYRVALATTFAAGTTLSAAAWRPVEPQQSFRGMPKARAEQTHNAASFAKLEQLKAMHKVAPTATMDAGQSFGFLDGPNGNDFYYVAQITYETIVHEYFVENNYKGFKITVYDDNLQTLGTVEDEIELDEKYLRCNDFQVAPCVTRKFFNWDDAYEIMVALSFNPKEGYYADLKTKVYSLGKNEPITELGTYYVDAVNTEQTSYGENFFLTFIGQTSPAESMINGVMNAFDYTFTVYKKAGYDSPDGPKEIGVMRYPQICQSGENAIDFISHVNKGKAYFALNHLQYSFWLNPYDESDERLTPDNAYIITLFEADNYGMKEVKKTYIPAVVPDDSPGAFYYLGQFSYNNDMRFGYWNDDNTLPCYLVTRQTYIPSSDDYTSDFYVYDTEGELLMTLGENIDGLTFQSDVPGHDQQVMLIHYDDVDIVFDFVNVRTGEMECQLPYELGRGFYMNNTVDRVPVGSSYQYVVSQLTAGDDEEGNTLHPIVFLDDKGDWDHVEYLNLGKGVSLAMVNIVGSQLNPYIFNSDDEREYQVLLKRLDSLTSGSSKSSEEFCIVSPSRGILQQWGTHEDYGQVISGWLATSAQGKRSYVIAYGKKDDRNVMNYTMTFTDLPFESMAGQGTAENPYKITSIGDLHQVRVNPSANYELTADLDGSLMPLETIENFSGVLDGKGHTISNLTLTDGGIFGELHGIVKDLVITDAKVMNVGDHFGIIADQASGATIENVKVYDTAISTLAASTIGGLAGQISLYSKVNACAMLNCKLDAPRADVGGLVGRAQTNSTVTAGVFTGSINGGENVGGIIASVSHRAAEGVANNTGVYNCHVDADILGGKVVGGVAGIIQGGMGERPKVGNCHVEGTLTSEAEAPAVGGIAGHVVKNYENPTCTDLVVYNNFVNLTSISANTDNTAYETDLVHRIVGKSSFNDPELVLDNFGNILETLDPLADKGLVNNYAIARLAGMQGSTLAPDLDANTTPDGAEISAEGLTGDFYDALGFKFGNTAENPWKEGSQAAPEIWFEEGMLQALTPSVQITEGKTFQLAFAVRGLREVDAEDLVDNFRAEFDAEVLQLKEVETDESTHEVTVTFKALSAGSTTVKGIYGGMSAEAQVTVLKDTSAVEEILNSDGSSALTYDGMTVKAAGADIAIYNLQGIRVATGRGQVSTAALAPGLYVAVTAGNSLKFRK